MKRRAWLTGLVAIVVLLVGLLLPGCGQYGSSVEQQSTAESTSQSSASQSAAEQSKAEDGSKTAAVSEDGTYTSKEDVALYLHTYGHLPSNYVTKEEAEDAGWKTMGLSLAEACPGKSIGGSRFGNYEGNLPAKKGRKWYECDIDYNGEKSRNAKRIVYSNDGLIYYTDDHYQTFEQLY